MRISDWSSDVCSADLHEEHRQHQDGALQQRQVALEDGGIEQEAGVRPGADGRSEERRGGKECVSTCRTRWAQDHERKTIRKDVQSVGRNGEDIYKVNIRVRQTTTKQRMKKNQP